ncbi:porin [Candidatus Pelagibacter sp.]|nr:porin [Candidatus Pelagibacter sp.]
MNNLKKVGLTALGTALVASSAQAADFSMSATSQITFAGADNGVKGNGWSMSDSITFSASGEMDNGMTISHTIELDGGAGVGANTLSIDTGDMGKLTFVGGSSTSVINAWDDLTPTANEEAHGVGYMGTPAGAANGPASTHNIFIYDYTVMDGLAIKAGYTPSHSSTAIDGSMDYGIHYTGVENLDIYAAMGENNDAANEADLSMMMVKYTMGALSVGYQVNETDFGTGTADEDFSAIGVSYAVSDDLSVSLNSSTIDFESSTLDDQEATAVSFSHTSGGMTISGSYGSMDNVAGSSTTDNSAYELNVKFAF